VLHLDINQVMLAPVHHSTTVVTIHLYLSEITNHLTGRDYVM